MRPTPFPRTCLLRQPYPWALAALPHLSHKHRTGKGLSNPESGAPLSNQLGSLDAIDLVHLGRGPGGARTLGQGRPPLLARLGRSVKGIDRVASGP